MIEKFIQYLRCIKGYSYNTCRAYEFDVRQFAAWLLTNKDGARWSTIDRQTIDEYIIYLREQGCCASTTNRVLASISAIYRYFEREGMIDYNPTKYETRAKLPETQPNTIPMTDLWRAYEHARGCVRTMLGLLITTGLRIQELLDMQWEDVDFGNNSIKVHGKGQKERMVYTTASILAPLAELAKHSNVHGRMFWMCQRKARFMIYDALRPFTRAKQVSPHAIRHSYATQLAAQGVNVAAISQALGHKHLETTQKYIDMAQVETASKSLPELIIKHQ